MKLGVVGPLPPLRGGISHYNDSLITTLREGGHEVTAISFKQLYPRFLFPGKSEIDPASPPFENMSRLLLAWNPHTWCKARRQLKRAGIERLIMHHWHPFFVPCLRYLTALKPPGGTWIIAHNVIPHEHRKAGIFLNRFLFRRVTTVVVGGRMEADNLQRLAPSTRYEVVPHPIYDRFCKDETLLNVPEAKNKLGYPPDKPLLMHVGLVRKYKGVDILLEAFAKMNHPDAHLEVAGEFYDDVRIYEELVDRLGLRDRVTLVDKYLAKEEMSLRLQAADVVVLPYRHATQSGIAMAALACGAPVIATSVGAIPDVIEPGVFGDLVPPEDTAALADAMNRFLLIDPAEREAMRRKIAPLAHERFSWRNLADKLTGDVA